MHERTNEWFDVSCEDKYRFICGPKTQLMPLVKAERLVPNLESKLIPLVKEERWGPSESLSPVLFPKVVPNLESNNYWLSSMDDRRTFKEARLAC